MKHRINGGSNVSRDLLGAVIVALGPMAFATPVLSANTIPAAPPVLLAQAEEAAPPAIVHGVGVVVATHPEWPAVTVNHEDMPGFMPPMEMMYSVQSKGLLAGLTKGDKVRFTIDTVNVAITEIAVVEKIPQ
jgi:Cu/Ag efflux protein CusF